MAELIEHRVQRDMIERRPTHQGNRAVEQKQDEQFAASTGIDPGFAFEPRVEKRGPTFGQIDPAHATTLVIVVEQHHGNSPGSVESVVMRPHALIIIHNANAMPNRADSSLDSLACAKPVHVKRVAARDEFSQMGVNAEKRQKMRRKKGHCR